MLLLIFHLFSAHLSIYLSTNAASLLSPPHPGAIGSQGSTRRPQAKVELCDTWQQPSVPQGEKATLWAQHSHPKPASYGRCDENCSAEHTAV